MHLEVISSKAKALLPFFANFNNFYLAGGTALAFSLGHRSSQDFDFFSDKPIQPDLFRQLERVFTGKKVSISVNNSDELTVFIDGIKVTFLYYPFHNLFQLKKFRGIWLADAKDIAVMKAYTIGRRGSFKDYVDLYFILRDKIDTLQGLIKKADKKYKDAFDPRLFLEQLVYFGDITDTKIKFLRERATPKALKVYLENEVNKVNL